MASEQRTFLNGRLIVRSGDITDETCDVIVNAANKSLLGGGGVDGAIHDRGGPEILAECEMIRETRYPEGLPTGQVVMTTAGKLRAKAVIHTVGPIYGRNGGEDARLLAECYRNSCSLAIEAGYKSIAFPSISTGVYGYPKEEAAIVAARTVRSVIEGSDTLEVRLVFFSHRDLATFFFAAATTLA